MAFQVRWTDQAAEDLKGIVQYIARDNPDAAHALANRIINQLEKAADSPMANRIVPEKNDKSLREILLRLYRLIYQIDQNNTVMSVARIWHAARGIPKT